MKCFPTGVYELDFDGDGPLPTVNATCDMSTSPPQTIVHTTEPCNYKVQGHEDPKNYSLEINYELDYEVGTMQP